MKRPITNIGILLLLIIVLPPLFFTTYEVGNLYQNEQMIDSIYTSQLESVLFSINQYSDDAVSGWANQIERDLQDENLSVEETAQAFIQRNMSVMMVLLADSLNIEEMFLDQQKDQNLDFTEQQFEGILQNNEVFILRFLQYMESGYRRIQPIDIDIPNHSLFLFAYYHSADDMRICGLVVNSESFIKENLGPKIQAVAQDKFYISVFEKSSDVEVYSNEFYDATDKNIEHKKELWLMPDYQLGIQLKGDTIEDLVRKRTRSNMWLIGIIDIVLILAAWFVYRAVRQQVKLAQLKSDFVANVSHEIRTPLAIINMYSETLEMDRIKSEEKKHEYYKVIHTETNRLSGIVNKILSFSKIESGKRGYKFFETDLNEVIEQIINTYQHHFKTKGFACTFKPGTDIPRINVDKEAITDVIINLIDNAMKYSNNEKRIEIITGYEKRQVFIEVKDYGIGIDEKDQKLIFDKFYRVTKGDLAYKAKGSGIGLSIVKHIMDAHKGSIKLISAPGNGSRFILIFPQQVI